MKHILPLIVSSAAVSFAQVSPAQSASASANSVGVEYFDVSSDTIDYDGYGLSAQFKVASPVSVALSYRDASSDSFDALGFGSGKLDMTRYSIGVVTSHSVGSGSLNLGLAYAVSNLEATIAGLGSGDLADNKQIVLSLGYDIQLAGGFGLNLGLAHYFNDAKLDNGFGGVDLDLDDVTAPSITLSYSPAKAVTILLSYSTEDAALGLPDADSTVTIGLRANF